ncbi:hypothetical protein RirG_104520 [Rhizophagus irregularis DAOM 197198w]|uniref:F-box domain-containing protein n=1 Tax=Rhizophagus irregularis (strain DAOM 197198w) TaxID=1432141 RepID=A0A015L7H7_RHIIW|nr:hypothetical protein RirG_104520 [Rhizophagus irregularis DAOM 197198w]
MACSKIFSGDLPELTEEIIQYFRKDFSTLYSCILVNRLWCRLAIPLLWEDPFSAPTQNHHCIKTYFCFLSEDSKAKLNEYEINDNLILSNTLFNYPSFIKYLDIKKICRSIKYWNSTLADGYNNELGKLIYRSLFEVFIENEGNLQSFEVILNTINIFQEVFNQLNVLESFHIIYCYSLNFELIQQIIKKFSDCLENFGFGFMNEEYNESKQQLFEFIMKYCKKIRYFESGVPNYDNIYLFIENNQHNNINYLTIKVDYIDHYTVYNKLSSTVLQNLGQVLPSKLEYLCLTLSIKTSDLEIFLKNSQNTFIEKLLIRNIVMDEIGNISFCIKKYIMKKERFKYLAILSLDDNADESDLFFLKDEVNEFKLHNIIVQNYDVLHINEYDYINNHLQY